MTKSSKTILFAVTIAPTIDVLMSGQIEWMISQGYVVHTCASGVPHFPTPLPRESYRHFEVGMTRKFSPLQDIKNLFQWFSVLRQSKPDILVASTPKAALVALVAGAFLRVPKRIYLLRGLRLETIHGWRRAVLWCAEKVCALAAHNVVAVSPSVAAEFVNTGLATPSRVQTVGSGSSNGVNAARFLPVPPAIRAAQRLEHGFSEHEIVVAFVGRLVQDKGWDVFCQAVANVQAIHPEVKALAMGANEEDLAIPAGINYLGVQKHLESWYQIMDVLILPTFREGFPNVPLEAAACEVPTIASRATGAIDSVTDGVTGLLVNVGDVLGTTDALTKLVEDSELRVAMGKNARQRVIAEFTPEEVWRGYLKIFDPTT